MRPFARAMLAITLVAQGFAAEDTIWVEGESATTSNLTRHGWYADVKTGLLSGGDFASHFDAAKVGTVEYTVTVAKAGTYHFWIRACFIAAELSYRLNGGAMTTIDLAKNRSDEINIASNDQPDLRFLAWVKVGDVALTAGANRLAFAMTSANHHGGAIDCFVLTSTPFTPNGALRPGQKLGLAMPGHWAFEPDADEFGKAMLDLRSLNEKTAGESGWLKRSREGDFALGNGKPARLWAAVTGVQERGDREALTAHAKHLAKRGINLVRYHADVTATGEHSKLTDVNDATLDRLHLLVAAMKAEGIYTAFNPYWAHTKVKPSWQVAGLRDGEPWGMLFWDAQLQAAYKNWITQVFTRTNPYTGIPLAQDPAFGLFIIQNEDSMLFWTMQTLRERPAVAARLSEKYGAWLTKQHGSLAKAVAAWGGSDGTHFGVDDVAKGQAGFLGMWEFNPGQGGGRAGRLADQLRFFAETMHAFNRMIGDFITTELKCPILVCAGNWRTANQNTLLDAERWSYTANDVIGCNRYTGGVHVNPREGHKSGYLVSAGDYFSEESCLLNPRRLPIACRQVAGLPFIIPESTWVPPERYQSEGPFLIAAYSALTGIDAYCWFALGQVGYDASLTKWQAASPAIMGGWPAAALLFRQGYVQRATPAVHEERRLDDLWSLRSSLLVEEEGFDPNRDASAIPKESSVTQAVDPLAFLVGPVEVNYQGDPAKSSVVDLATYIDPVKKTVASSTRELTWDWGTGICRLDAPKAQGVTGFLAKASPFALSAVTITSTNDYATVLVVSLDGLDLAKSKRVLVQTTTSCRPYGWKDSATSFTVDKKTLQGKRIDSTGSAPWNVVDTQVTVTVKNALLTKATMLDANGYAVRVVPTKKLAGVVTTDLPREAMYVILE